MSTPSEKPGNELELPPEDLEREEELLREQDWWRQLDQDEDWIAQQ